MTNPNIRMGLQIPSFTYPNVGNGDLFETIAGIAVTAEEHGFDSVLRDGPLLPVAADRAPRGEHARGLHVAVGTRRADLEGSPRLHGRRDDLSQPGAPGEDRHHARHRLAGRAIWGIGAGWFEQEHIGYGFEFGTFTERFEKLEEGLQIAKSMFVNDTTTFEGKWFTVKDALNSPKPVQAGGPPVLIGGSGERKTLRMVAQYGDACNVFGDATQVRHLMGVLDEHCARIGRDPKEICRTRLGTLLLGRTMEHAQQKLTLRLGGARVEDLPEDVQARVRDQFILGDADTVGERVGALLSAGLDGVIFNLADAYDLESVAMAGDVLSGILRS